MSRFHLPDLGEGLQEAEIVAWHVGPKDHVAADQPLVSVETDKAVVEIPAPRSGTVARLLVAVGDIVTVGAPLLEFEEGPSQGAGAIVGDVRPRSAPPAAPIRPVAAPAGQPRIKATPAVRRLARERGVELEGLRPSGAHGEVTRQDVLAAAVGADWEPLRGARRTMALTMAEAGARVVPATVMDEVEVSAWPADAPVTAFLVRAVVTACREEPGLNAWFDPQGPRRLLHGHVDLGIAVDTPDGLLVPVLREAERHVPADLERELQRLIGLARSRAAQPEDYRGATITLSNFGSLGGRHATLVVIPPQVAILGAGRIYAPGGDARHRLLPVSLTFDHRAVTGGEAARFLSTVAEALRAAQHDVTAT